MKDFILYKFCVPPQNYMNIRQIFHNIVLFLSEGSIKCFKTMPGNSCPDVTLEIPRGGQSKFTLLTFTKFESRFLHNYCFDYKTIYGGGIQGVFWPGKKFFGRIGHSGQNIIKNVQKCIFCLWPKCPPFIFFKKIFFSYF